MHDPGLGVLHPTNSLSCEGRIFPVFRGNLEIFSESSQDTLIHFSSTCFKEIIYKKIFSSYENFL